MEGDANQILVGTSFQEIRRQQSLGVLEHDANQILVGTNELQSGKVHHRWFVRQCILPELQAVPILLSLWQYRTFFNQFIDGYSTIKGFKAIIHKNVV